MESLSVSDVLYAIGVQFDVLKVIVDLVFSTVMMLDFVVCDSCLTSSCLMLMLLIYNMHLFLYVLFVVAWVMLLG